MIQNLTLVCKLNPTPEQGVKIKATLQAFSDACNDVNEHVKSSITSKRTIQALVYNQIRQQFGLSANLAVRACARVGASHKTAKSKGKKVKSFRPTSADYDARIFAFRERDWNVSLTLIGGREHVPMHLGNYQRGKLKGRQPTSAQLCQHRDGCFYLHIQLKDKTPEPAKVNKVIGVDFGRRDIAVTSEGDKWDGAAIKQTRDRFSRVRASLQSKGTKNAKRVLKRLSGRERRYQTWLNHTISRSIINRAKQTDSAVAIEDLMGIRARTNKKPRNKTERRRSNSWAFYQLRTFLEYKGIQSGVEVIAVPPQYTSQTCHHCLHIGQRLAKSFRCDDCEWHGDADFNGSQMIRLLGQCVTLPGESWLSCKISRGSKAHALSAA